MIIGGMYQVSNFGRIKSLQREVWNGYGYYTINEKIIEGKNNGNGYLYVALYKNGKGKRFYLHRLVAHIFISNPKNKPCVDHIDTNKQNNNQTNLRWCTNKENQNNKLTKKKMSDCQNKNKIIAINNDSKTVKIFESLSQTSKYGFDKGAVWRCCNGKQKEHLGHKFYYLKDFNNGDENNEH